MRYNFSASSNRSTTRRRSVVNARRSIPVKFSLSGDKGLNIFEAGFPVSQRIACNDGAPSSEIEQTVTAGGSSLSYYAESDTSAAIRPLLDRTCQVDARDNEGETALMIAAQHGHTTEVKALLKKGADVNATTNESAYYYPGNSTALMFAAAEGRA